MADDLVIYAVTPGARLRGGKAAAEIVGRELESIDRERGQISADSVIDRARTPGTALNAWDHAAHYFEWDDTVAAEEHRREQARQLIRAVTIRVESGDQRLATRGFRVINSLDKGYRPTQLVVADPSAHRAVIDRFQNDILRMDASYRAYLAYADFAQRAQPVFNAIDAVIDQLAEEGEPRAQARRSERYRRQGGHVRLVQEKTKS